MRRTCRLRKEPVPISTPTFYNNGWTHDRMDFDPTAYGPEVARILAMDENGQRCAPLVCGPVHFARGAADFGSA